VIVSGIAAFSVNCGRAEVTNSEFPAAPTSLRVKVKVKLSLCLIKHYTMKTYGGMDV
jgi:hypothetical protein